MTRNTISEARPIAGSVDLLVTNTTTLFTSNTGWRRSHVTGHSVVNHRVSNDSGQFCISHWHDTFADSYYVITSIKIFPVNEHTSSPG